MLKQELINYLLETKIPSNLGPKDESKIVEKIFQLSWNLTPKNLYRYRSCNENNFNALEQNKFLLTKPTLFNDPYDSLLYINRKKIIDSITKNQNFDIVKKLKNDLKFRNEQIELLGKEFVDRFLNLTPFKNSKERKSFKMISDIYYTNFLNELIDEAIKSLKQSSLVACLSEDFDSILMWSHYADNHRGFVLNYDFQSRFSIDVGIPGIKATEFADKKIFPVSYTNKKFDATNYIEFHFIYNFLKNIKIPFKEPFFDKLFYYKILLFKSIDWKYEKEWRIIKQTNINYNDNKADFEFIHNIVPTEILLGSKIENKDKERLVEISKEKKIPIFQMSLEPFSSKYKLTKSKI